MVYHFIINPLAASGKAAMIWRNSKQYIEKKGILYEAYMTSYKGHARSLAYELTSGEEKYNEKIIVVVGGSGTLNEVINGISISAQVTIGYVPVGSRNGFARSMKISRNPRRALRRIFNPRKVHWIDYGVMAYMDTALHHRRFLVSSGMGIDAEICNDVSKPSLYRKGRRHLGYVWTIFKELLFFHPYDCELLLDYQRKINLQKVAFTSVHIAPYECGRFCLAPQADVDDGQFEILVISGATRRRVLKVLVNSLFGSHKNLRGVHHYRCKEFSISASEGQSVHVDGEMCGSYSNISYACEKQKLHMLL
jgi:YegS/Rv2252/BmrU family lipid kinase